MVDSTKQEIQCATFCRKHIGKFNNLYHEDGIDLEGQPNKMMEVEFVFKQGQITYSHVLLKGTFRFATSNFEDMEQEGQVYSKVYLEHMNQLIERYDKILVLNLLNVEHGIENSEVEMLETVIQRNPIKAARYHYKNLLSVKTPIVESCIELMTELEPIFKAFMFNETLPDGQPSHLQVGVVRVNCFDCGDVSDMYIFFHFLMLFKQIFYRESLSDFEAFSRGFMMASTLSVMAIRGMFVNVFKRTNLLMNHKESTLSNSLSTEMPLEFQSLKERANKIIKQTPNDFNRTIQNLIKNQRSMLVERVKGEVSKFGLEESRYFQNKAIRVMITTWNVGGYKPASYKEINNMFATVSEDKPSLIVVGLQEIFEMKSKNIGRILNISQTATRTTRWKFLITQCLNTQGFFNLISEDDLAGIQVLVFAASSIADDIKNVSSSPVKMGILGMANKGAIVVSMQVHDTPVKFAVCHLNAGESENDSASRIDQINELLQGEFAKDNIGYRFLTGDLNFRLNLDNESVILMLKELRTSNNLGDRKKRLHSLLSNDQLHDQLKSNKLLMGFTEADINFNPTYKMDPFLNEYMQKKNRTPSWTDRVLFSYPSDAHISIVRYNSTPTLGSDHRPVCLVADIDIKSMNKEMVSSYIDDRMNNK